MNNSPIVLNDPEGDCPVCIVAIAAAVVNGGVNVASQALKGNVTNLWQGLEYFGVGAAAGAAYVVPGGGPLLAGSIQAGGNKVVQIANGQFEPSDIDNPWDLATTALDIGLDFATPALGANLGKGLANSTLIPLAERFGWTTTVSGGNAFLKSGGAIGDIAFSATLDEAVSVTASRAGAKTAGIGANSIIAANGLKVTGFTKHGVHRAIGGTGRSGVSPSAILDAIKNPLKINNPCWRSTW